VKRISFQLAILMVIASLSVGGVFFLQRVLQIPFRSANDALHGNGAALTLDFLIPAGTHIDDKIAIGQVVKIRLTQKSSPFGAVLHTLSDLIPAKYAWLGNILLFFFWSFCVLTLLRIFTFMGYGRALRTSLLVGGITYYFMPDFSPYVWDDVIFVVCPLLLIFVRSFWLRRKKRIFKGD